MVKLLRKVDQWVLIGKEIAMSPTDIDSDGVRLIARGRTLGGALDGTPFEKAVELTRGQSVHFGPHVVVTLLEVRSGAAQLGILSPPNVPVVPGEQAGQFHQRRWGHGK